MRIVLFSSKPYDREMFERVNERFGHKLTFLEPHLDASTVALANGFDAVCPFVNDRLDERVISSLAGAGVRLITLRSAGFNHVDLKAAREHGMVVARVPAYSPYAVAEHAMALILTLNRKLHRAYNRVREGNFALAGLLGFDLHGKTIGVIGTGKIGTTFCRIAHGFGCEIIAHDPYPNDTAVGLGAKYEPLETLLSESDVVVLHLPLTPETHHLIDDTALRRMKDGVMLINTSRGGLIDTRAVIRALKAGKVAALGLDVYEEEADLFFEDLSGTVIQDDVFARLLTFPNVLITSHQGFFTQEALEKIAETTLSNATAFEAGAGEIHTVTAEAVTG